MEVDNWIYDMASVGVYLYMLYGPDCFNVVDEFYFNLKLQGYTK